MLPHLKHLLLLVLFYLSSNSLYCQVLGKLLQMDGGGTFQVIITPNKTFTKPDNITNTGQITLKTSTGSFDLGDFQTLNGRWQFNSRINQPIESPDFDYIVFTLTTPMLNPNYENGVEFPLFQFSNANGCVGTIALIENGIDAFWPPNSVQANIGNHLTIFGVGIENAYHENDSEHSKIVCPSQLDFNYNFLPIKCAGETTDLSIYFNNGIIPFEYTLQLENGEKREGILSNRGDSIKITVPAGQHQLSGKDKTASITQKIEIPAPTPLSLEIIAQEKIGCDDLDGAIVELNAKGGKTEGNYTAEWSNGLNGLRVEGLTAANYTVTLTDINDCTTTKEINIEALPNLNFDSVEILSPLCFNDSDGQIIIQSIQNATPPIQYAINKNDYQENNFFERLTAGTYQLNVKDANNCRVNKEVVLVNPPELTVHLSPDTTVLKGQSFPLEPLLSEQEMIYYNWSATPILSCLDCNSPIVRPIQSTTLTLTISNEFGCEASATQFIKVIEQRPIYIPTAFSPNGDGHNDVFEIHIGATVSSIKYLSIFNRWGQLIYEAKQATNNQSFHWNGTFNGKPVETGVYIYTAEIEMTDGSQEIYKGDFFIIK